MGRGHGALPHRERAEVDALNKRLLVVRPYLPDFITMVEIRHLRVGKGSVDLRFDRRLNGELETSILKTAGDLTVDIVPLEVVATRR